MATFAEIKEVRLRINDPPGFVDFAEVANAAALPADPTHQYGYKTTDTGEYWSTELESGASQSDYTLEDLQISDARISAYIDASDTDTATCQSIKQIISNIGKSMGVERSTNGADTIVFAGLKDNYDYYKGLLSLCQDTKKENNNNDSGRFYKTKTVEIAGGNI